MSTQYRIFRNHCMEGPYDLDELLKLENLPKETLVCEVGDIEWQSMKECKSIQQALKPLRWGAVQQPTLRVSPLASENVKSEVPVSNSGDFVQKQNRSGPLTKAPEPKLTLPTPAQKGGLFSWISSLFR